MRMTKIGMAKYKKQDNCADCEQNVMKETLT